MKSPLCRTRPRLLGYGLDFVPDPAAIVAVYYHNDGYILDETLYAKRLVNADLATTFKLLPASTIVADSAAPKSNHVVPWRDIITDQVDIASGVKIERRYYTPAELKTAAPKG